VNLIEFYRESYLPMRLVGKSPGSLAGYAMALRRWSQFSTADIEQIDSRLLAGWQAWMLPGHSPATVNSYMRHVRAILNYAASEEVGVLARPPTIRMLREPRRSPLALTVEEFAAVLRMAEHEPNAPLWRALLLTAWESGLRLRSLVSLRPVDVLFNSDGLYAQAEGMKNAVAQWFPLQPETLQAIRTIYSLENERLFTFRIAPRQIQRIMRRILDTSGIYAPHGSGMCFHRLRKSKASYTKLAGGDATAALGHSRPEITVRYLDPRICGQAVCPPMPMPRF
jgi:integrase